MNQIVWHRLVLSLVLWIGLASRVCAQSVSLEVQPNAIPVSVSYSEVQARVVLKNSTASSIKDLTLSAITNDGFEIQIGTHPTKNLGTSHSATWPIKITNLNRAHIPGTILVDAQYRAAEGDPQHVFAPVSITSAPDGSTKPVEASIEGNFDSVSEQRPGTGSPLVTNSLNVPVQVSVQCQVPENTLVLLVENECLGYWTTSRSEAFKCLLQLRLFCPAFEQR